MPRQNPEVMNRYVTETYVNESGQVSTYPRSFSSFYRAYASNKTPGYWQKRAAGSRLPMNPYWMTMAIREGMEFTVTDRYRDGGGVYGSTGSHSSVMFPVSPLASVPASVRDEASATAAKRLRNRLSGAKANLALAFREQRQTANLMVTTASRIVQAARALRRADFRAFTRALSIPSTYMSTAERSFRRVEKTPVSRRIADHWLEYTYGWVPLLSDVYDAAELLAEQHSRNVPRGKFASTATVSWKNYVHEPDGGLGGFRSTIVTTYTARVRMTCSAVLADEAASLLSKTGISNPGLLAWESLPFSFLVDRFLLDIGSYLEALKELDGLVITDIVQSTIEEAKARRTVRVYNDPSYYLVTEMSMVESLGRDVLYNRTPLLNIPLPELEFRNPLTVARQASQMASVLSLLRQLFR